MDSEQQYRQFRQQTLGQPPQSPLAKLAAFVLSAAFMVLAFMFSLVALAVVAVVGIALGGWLWWRTRKLRQAINAQRAAGWSEPTGSPIYRNTSTGEGSATIIEGQAVRMSDEPASSPSRRIDA